MRVYVLTEEDHEHRSEFPCVTIGVYRDVKDAVAEANRLSIERYGVSNDADTEERDTTWLVEEFPLTAALA